MNESTDYVGLFQSAPPEPAGRGGAGRTAAPPAGRYLEPERNTVLIGSSRVEVRACGCRSWFCPHCCIHQGIVLKRRLLERVRRFAHPMLLTLTIDPELFSCPRAAWEYVREHRCIAVTVQRLHRWGLVRSRHFFVVVEWQRQSEMAHWHVLVDADFIPWEKLREAWNRNWERWEDRVALGRPGFGSVRFSKPSFRNTDHAACYVAKYLTKYPGHGYPDWVLSGESGSVRRYSTSRGFWGNDGAPAREQGGEPVESDESDGGECAPPDHHARRSIREQVASCGEETVALRMQDQLNRETGEVESVCVQFIGRIAMPMHVLRQHLGLRAIDEKGRRAEVDGGDVDEVYRLVRQRGTFEPVELLDEDG